MRLLREYIREVLDGFGNHLIAKDGVAGNLRYDVPVRVHGGNVLRDAEDEEQRQRQGTMQAATVLVLRGDKVLGVSRKDDPDDFGLPGGKVEPGEDPAVAAARELEEETGLRAVELKPVFVRRDADGFVTTTFMGDVRGEISTDEEGVVRWVEPETLFKGSFGDYNLKLFAKLGLLRK